METSFNAPDPDPSTQRPTALSADREPTPSAAPSRWDLARRRLGLMLNDKWHLDDLLGVGGMAAVYAATHRNGSRVAIKLLPFSLSTGPEVCQRLLREGYLANRIAHHAVVRVLDDHIDYEREYAYLVMDLLVGETARQRFDSLGTFSPIAAIDLMLELADCLQAAHAANVIHRDIKPENLFLTENGLKVLDFGIARALDGNSSLTQTGTSLGTPAYMSPEQARGKQNELSIRSDIYSVGATLLFLLTGETLHTGENPMELMVKVAWTPAPSASSVCPSLPAPIAHVIDRCCTFEPGDRYHDSAALQVALKEAREQMGALPSEPPARWSERPASIRPISAWPREPSVPADAETLGILPEPKDNKRWIGVALVAAALLAGGIWLNRRTPTEPAQNLELGTRTQIQPHAASTSSAIDNVNAQDTALAPRSLAEAMGPAPTTELSAPSALPNALPNALPSALNGTPAATDPRPAFSSPTNAAARPSSGDERHHTADGKLSSSSSVLAGGVLPGGVSGSAATPSPRPDGPPSPSKPKSADFDDARRTGTTESTPNAEPNASGKKRLKPLRYDAFRKGNDTSAPSTP